MEELSTIICKNFLFAEEKRQLSGRRKKSCQKIRFARIMKE
jgi:hypothetical protein